MNEVWQEPRPRRDKRSARAPGSAEKARVEQRKGKGKGSPAASSANPMMLPGTDARGDAPSRTRGSPRSLEGATLAAQTPIPQSQLRAPTANALMVNPAASSGAEDAAGQLATVDGRPANSTPYDDQPGDDGIAAPAPRGASFHVAQPLRQVPLPSSPAASSHYLGPHSSPTRSDGGGSLAISSIPPHTLHCGASVSMAVASSILSAVCAACFSRLPCVFVAAFYADDRRCPTGPFSRIRRNVPGSRSEPNMAPGHVNPHTHRISAAACCVRVSVVHEVGVRFTLLRPSDSTVRASAGRET
eukprot:1838910-Prymnesium_polylepis.2